MNDDQLKKIEKKACRLGFDAVGWTSDFKPQHTDYLKNWVYEKKYGDMVWFERTLSSRLDPQIIDRNIQSAIVLLTSYKHTPKPGNKITLARYAYGKDYHIWIHEKQNRLIDFIRTEIDPDFVGRSSVDAGPVLERDLAVKAGLGWIGKNTCLIHPKLGSFVFISVILTNISTFSNSPLPGRQAGNPLLSRGFEDKRLVTKVTSSLPRRGSSSDCGDCTKCLTACPTQALKPHQLEQKRCRAYQANAKKGERDQTLWKDFGASVFGCDICQEVCPWNKKAPDTCQKEWQETFEKYHIADLKKLLQMTESDYKTYFKGSVLDRNYIDQMRNIFLVIAFQKKVDLLEDVINWKERHADLNMAECTYCLEKLK